VRIQLTGWWRHAQAIPEPSLRGIALGKLRDERFNSEVAATLATLASLRKRRLAIDAIVALQVAYDYLDLLTELYADVGVDSCESMLMALADAVGPQAASSMGPDRRASRYQERGDDGGYLAALVETVQGALRELPARAAVRETATAAAQRCASAQARNHAAPRDQLAAEPPELLAGAAASVLCLHALIAAAANPQTTPAEARQLDALYLSIGALSMLDSLLDVGEDAAIGQLGYLERYASPQEMARQLTVIARDAIAAASRLPNNAGHHLLTIAGVLAYYASSPDAAAPPASTVMRQIERELRPLLAPALWTMRTWRTAKRLQLVSSSSIGVPLHRSSPSVGERSRQIRSSGAAEKAVPKGML
jgi:tetraprenyl-beta-curcumene synthase